jgi:hypothetical protein
MTTHEYEIKLNLNEQRMALMSLVESINKSYASTKKKRSLRLSEKAMALSSLATKQIAVLMAVDRIDEALKAEIEGAQPFKGVGMAAF